jgi:protein involved in polysaccharide export with SLBB domain
VTGRTSLVLALLGVSGLMFGCDANSFFDPSVVGGWKPTPVVMPILDRLSAIEDEPAEYVQTSPVLPGDLMPEVDQYRLGPGDVIDIKIRDYFVIGQEEMFERQIDQRGYIDIPRLPAIHAGGKTPTEIIKAVEDAIRTAQINDRPVVALDVKTQRKQTFSVLGAVQNPGTYFIPSPDYRLLEGLTAAGSINETIPFIYVVRQVPLTKAAAGEFPDAEANKKRIPGRPPSDNARPPEQGKEGEDLNKVINDILEKKPEPKSPGIIGDESLATPARIALAEPPPIDLPDPNKPAAAPGTPQSNWIYSDGKWVKVRPSIDGSSPAGGARAVEQALVTQRVIKIPTGPLLAGAADVNVILRPGDVVRIPVPKSGLVYVTGQVVRPGPYQIPQDGRLTVLRALDAAGGLNNIAIPEKVEITRMVGNDRQATILLNVRAIAAFTQPDIYLKPDDRINVGTNFWAQPVAILRNGFRASYGFGFILDRNFQGDVFGPDIANQLR